MSEIHGKTPSTQARHEALAELVSAIDVSAPERLHERVRDMVAPRPRTSRELIAARLKPTLAAVAVAMVAGAAIALLSGGGTETHSPSIREASALTLRAPTIRAPHESSAHSARLDVAVDGVAFPYWEERFGWRTTGARTDTVGGRRITTVFYEGTHGARIGYAIVAGTPAPSVTGGTVAWLDGVPYRLLRENGLPVVVWQRNGRLCVLSGRGVSEATLLRLAGSGDASQSV
jgi:hypothetical protein